MRRFLVSGLIVAAFGLATPAFADPEECAREYETAQRSRAAGKLLEAHHALITCSQDACPIALRKDCIPWLKDVTSEIPWIAIRVHGVSGCDEPEALITIDGVDFPGAASGRSIEINPGSHTIRAAFGEKSATQVVVVSPGERHRMVVLELGQANATCGAPPSPPAASPASRSRSLHP